MGFLSKGGADNVAGGGGGNYLNPGKLQSGASMRFALCTDEPLEMFECWGENAEGKLKPFRFLEEPTAEDISSGSSVQSAKRIDAPDCNFPGLR